MASDDGSGLIGIDGGGTSCRIALQQRGRRTEVVLGSANVTSDFAGAIGLIREGLDMIAEKAELPLEGILVWPAYLGLAGVVDQSDAESVAKELPLTSAQIEDDRRATLIGALGGMDGTVAGVGTGSFIARQSDLGVQLVGGWGLRLGDEASGAWLGRQLLGLVLEVVDGLREETALIAKTFEAFDRSPGKIVKFSREAPPVEFATLAPRIIDAAEAGDPSGVFLMEEGAAYLERTIVKLGWRKGERLCLVGGIAPRYRDYLSKDLARSVVPAKGTALDGALRLAASLAVQNGQAA